MLLGTLCAAHILALLLIVDIQSRMTNGIKLQTEHAISHLTRSFDVRGLHLRGAGYVSLCNNGVFHVCAASEPRNETKRRGERHDKRSAFRVMIALRKKQCYDVSHLW